jgi:hypothetical protein
MKAMNLAAMLGAIGLALLAPASAQAQAWEPWPMLHGNDTGGIIPWSCENEAVATRVAANYCAQYRKYARITSVTRHYGNYISFNCLWTPSVGRYDLPAVATRTSCPTESRLLTK